MRRSSRFFHLSNADKKLLLRTGLLLWVVRFGLWLLPYAIFRQFLLRLRHPVRVREEDQTRVRKIVQSVKLMSPYVPAATCLISALVAQILLEESGQSACLRIGVAKSESGMFEAHAWVESRGKVIVGGTRMEISRYSVLRPNQF
jgi:hypothetical protein